ncbi:MAG: cupin domain-containing protein [Pseudomonadota bacterium]
MGVLDDGWILDAASGAGPRAMSVLAEAQARLNPAVSARKSAAEAAMSAMFEAENGIALDPGALEAVLSATRAASMTHEVVQTPGALGRLIDDPLAGEGLGWRRRPGGIEDIRLEDLEEPGLQVRLLRLSAGRSVPEHDHTGDEYTLILAGGLADSRGEYHRGDVCVAGPGVLHAPRVFDDADCICFTVAFGGRRFSNPLTAVFDRLVGGMF